jgi:hypothetical protein
VTDDRPTLDPFGQAIQWVAKITTVALEMVLPTIGGVYLDKRFGTRFWTLTGVVVGLVVGLWHLLQMTRPRGGSGQGRKESSSGSSGE